MVIAGLQNLSLVDYPGHLALTVFVQGCNFRCGYCHNPELVTLDAQFECTEEQVLACISNRKDKIEGVVITGGEPTLYRDIPDFAKEVKKMGLKVKLDTNGSNPDRIMGLLRASLIDYVSIDIKTAPSRYDLVTDSENMADHLSESVYTVMLSTIPYEFRTTCVPGIVDEEDFREIGALVRGAKNYCLQQFSPGITFDERFQDVHPYPPQKIHRFKDILESFAISVRTRGF